MYDKSNITKAKQELIDSYLAEPVKEGDRIIVTEDKVNGAGTKDIWAKAISIKDGMVEYYNRESNFNKEIDISRVRKNPTDIGQNPFQPEVRHQSYQIDIDQLFFRAGFDSSNGESRMERYFDMDIPEVNLEPVIVNEDGEEVGYQRGYVWSLEEKQNLIESIYNNIEIGKFVFRVRPFQWVEDRVKAGILENTAFKDLVDGKQRLTALKEFVIGEFTDIYGNYFGDLSETAQREFLSYRHLTYIELGEKSTDQDTINAFLAVNFTGVPMSKEHIEYVKSIKL